MLDNLRRAKLNLSLITVPADYLDTIKTQLQLQNISFTDAYGKLEVSNKDIEKIDLVLKEVIIPNLLPAQFYWLLAKAGLEQAIDTLLESLKQTDEDKYAMYKGFLAGARFYEFSKALHMLEQAKPVIELAYPELDLSVPTLKAIWLQALKF